MSNRYTFTRQQLDRLLNEAVGLFVEYRDTHGHDEDEAQPLAVAEVFQGLDAERDLVAYGDIDAATLQEIPDDDDPPINERLSVGRRNQKAND